MKHVMKVFLIFLIGIVLLIILQSIIEESKIPILNTFKFTKIYLPFLFALSVSLFFQSKYEVISCLFLFLKHISIIMIEVISSFNFWILKAPSAEFSDSYDAIFPMRPGIDIDFDPTPFKGVPRKLIEIYYDYFSFSNLISFIVSLIIISLAAGLVARLIRLLKKKKNYEQSGNWGRL